MLMSVVFPAPLGPTMPTRSPRAILVLKSRTIGTPPKLLAICRASITFRPVSPASCMVSFTSCRALACFSRLL